MCADSYEFRNACLLVDRAFVRRCQGDAGLPAQRLLGRCGSLHRGARPCCATAPAHPSPWKVCVKKALPWWARCAKQRSEPTSDKRGAKADELTLTPLELIDRSYEVFPLLCPLCGGQMDDGVQGEPDRGLAAQPAILNRCGMALHPVHAAHRKSLYGTPNPGGEPGRWGENRVFPAD